MSLKGNSSGVPQANPEDMALVGDTRQELHYKPLPRQEHPYKAHQNPSHPESDSRVTG